MLSLTPVAILNLVRHLFVIVHDLSSIIVPDHLVLLHQLLITLKLLFVPDRHLGVIMDIGTPAIGVVIGVGRS